MAACPQPKKSVSFIERDDRLDPAVRGPRDTVMAELFQIARGRSNPDTAHLALTGLENFLAVAGGGTGDQVGAITGLSARKPEDRRQITPILLQYNANNGIKDT